jgi:hypothetical protein
VARNPQTNQSTAPDTTTAPPTNTVPTANAPPAITPRPQFFAGTITAITDDQITISRTLVGHQPDTRSFQLTPKTKLNKNNCKLNAKVTVRYQHLPEGDIALQVLVHPSSKPTAKRP